MARAAPVGSPVNSAGQTVLSATAGSMQAGAHLGVGRGVPVAATFAAIKAGQAPASAYAPSQAPTASAVQSRSPQVINRASVQGQPLQGMSSQPSFALSQQSQVQSSPAIAQTGLAQLPQPAIQPIQMLLQQNQQVAQQVAATQAAATTAQGQQIPGTVVTKTTVEKVFIPAESSLPPVAVTSSGAQVMSSPGIVTASPTPVPVTKAAVSDVPPSMLPTISAARVGVTVQGGIRPADYVVENGSFVPHSKINYIPIPQEGMGGHLSYNPATQLVENQKMYQIDDQGEMYQLEAFQGDGGYDVYQGDLDMQQYRDHFYEEDQQFQDQQYMDEQQFVNQQYVVDGYYGDQMNEMQGDGQYLHDGAYTDMNYDTYDVGADVAAGMPRAPEEKREDNPAEDQFTRLLNSLEARVDLMAQMQHTRAEIQKHTRNLQGGKASSDGVQLALPGVQERKQPYQVDLGPDRPFSSLMEDFSSTGRETGRFGFDGGGFDGGAMIETSALMTTNGSDAARLARENAMLRDEFQDQRLLIESLTNEVSGMKHTLHSIATDPGMLGRSAQTRSDLYVPAGTRVEARWMQDGNTAGYCGPWMAGYIAQDNQDGSFQVEYDNGDACSCVPRDCVRIWMEVNGEPVLVPVNEGEDDLGNPASGEEVRSLQSQLQEERKRHESSTQQWSRERQRLLEELDTLKGSSGRRAIGGLPVVGEHGEGLMITEPVLPLMGTQIGGRRGMVAPLCRNPCGLNIELSEDGYIAKRVRGCRQSVVVGSAPLEPQDLGCYFEVVVRETVNGWVGGLGLGVTRVSPAEMKRMPDKAWRIPTTFIVGYWGCVFLDGREKRTRWKADTLKVGSRVGLLVTGDGRGDLIVFVDGEPVVRADDVLPNSFSSAGMQEPLYPVIDVFAATLSVELLQTATAPAKPWGRDPSPPGSPASIARSINSSALGAP